MLVIADTSALIALAACDSLPLLEQVFQATRVPPAVFAECTVANKPAAADLRSYLETRVLTAPTTDSDPTLAGLGTGEREAIALYWSQSADWLLIDDQRARFVAQKAGIRIVGSLGVLVRAKDTGRISSLQSLLTKIQAAGIHYSVPLVTEALRLAGEA